MSSLSLSITAYSHRGRVRDKNDDHYLCGPFVEQDALCQLMLPLSSHTVQHHGLVCAVADGMGGYAGGALASRIVLETLAGFLSAEPLPASAPQEAVTQMKMRMERGFGHAREALHRILRRDTQLHEAGTTLAGVAVLAPGIAVPFHLGDSRVLRASGGFVRALTTDHTPLAKEISSGLISEEDAARSPLASQLTGCFGLEDNSPVEWGEPLDLAADDLFLIGTDGFHGLGRGLSNRTLREILGDFSGTEAGGCSGHSAAGDAVLVRQLIKRAVESDGTDNATLVLLRVTHVEALPPDIEAPE